MYPIVGYAVRVCFFVVLPVFVNECGGNIGHPSLWSTRNEENVHIPNWIHIYRAYLRFSHMIATSYTMNFHVNDPFQMIGLTKFPINYCQLMDI